MDFYIVECFKQFKTETRGTHLSSVEFIFCIATYQILILRNVLPVLNVWCELYKKKTTLYISSKGKFEPPFSLFIKRALSGASCVARSIIGAEDEDFENDLDQVSHLFLLSILTFVYWLKFNYARWWKGALVSYISRLFGYFASFLFLWFVLDSGWSVQSF